MKALYYDPMFYISSEEMPFTIRIETVLKDRVDNTVLSDAVSEAIKRYPYFSIQVVEDSGELLAVPNNLPIAVYYASTVYPLGSKEVNYHMLALSYCENKVNFFASHVITDGAGFFPFIKTVLYYYISARYKTVLDSTGIRLSDSPFYSDELGNPYPESKMENASALYEKSPGEFFRLRDGGYVNDFKKTMFRFRVKEDELMHFNHDHDGSPCALISSLMTKAIWSVHPNETKDIVSAVSFNLRPGLGNVHSYRMLCSALLLSYPYKLRNAEISKLCTCSRGMVMLQSHPLNVIYYARKRMELLKTLDALPDLGSKKKVFGKIALDDSVNNTFSVSYVGKVGLGVLEPYLESMYNITDGSTYKSVFIEVSAVNGWFDIAFLQGFSSDVYYRAFLEQLKISGLNYIEEGSGPLDAPEMVLP